MAKMYLVHGIFLNEDIVVMRDVETAHIEFNIGEENQTANDEFKKEAIP